MELKEIEKEDFQKAVRFAITGMHFNWYLDNRFLLNLYGRYFWYMEVTMATQIIAAYENDKFMGVLLARIKNEKPAYKSFWCSLYVKVFDFFQKCFFRGSAGEYEKCNKEMLAEYKENNCPDGEIVFLAADPDTKIKGIGTALLSELERREKGKTVYLYTDNACTYQFYEHRGFERSVEKDIIIDMGTKRVPLKCFLFSKKIM